MFLSCADAELQAFVRNTLGALLEYETDHPGANLTHTLSAFLTHNRTVADTARALYVHYNTVRYRLDRIESLVGPLVGDADHCLRLEVALRARALLTES